MVVGWDEIHHWPYVVRIDGKQAKPARWDDSMIEKVGKPVWYPTYADATVARSKARDNIVRESLKLVEEIEQSLKEASA